VALLQSESLVRDVLAASHDEVLNPPPPGFTQMLFELVTLPLRVPGLLYRSIHGVAPPDPLDDRVKAASRHFSVSDVKGSNLIEVAYEDGRPQWAAEFVNRIVKRHVERHVKLNQQSDALGFFESQQQLLSDRLQQAERALTGFYQRAGLEPGSEQKVPLTTRIAEQNLALAKAEAELAEGMARADFLTKELSGRSRTITSGPAGVQGSPLQFIRSRVLELELQRSESLSKFAPTSTKIQDLDRQIVEARRLMAEEQRTSGAAADPAHQTLEIELAQTHAQLAAVKARTEVLRSQVANDQARLQHLDQISPEQQRLEQDVATAKESLLTYSKKQEEARFSDALDESKIVNVTIVEPAAAPMAPLPSKRLLILLLGAAMSLFGGIGLACVRDRLDPTVKGGAEAQELTRLPILADIPL
jgi:uncharacterized protein involved in exopolysaccharide biosynthesis